MIKRLKNMWCDWFHHGGRITRDENGFINWRCDTCGRWAYPTAAEVERDVINQDIKAHLAKRGKGK